MSATLQRKTKLSFAEKLSRLGTRLRDPEWRRYGQTLLLGKAAGVAIVLAIIGVMSAVVFAHVHADDTPVKAADIVNPVNTAWTLVAAFLVFGMQVGFTMLEAGFCRSRETVNVLMECVVDTCLCGILFYAIGFAFMFSHGNGFIGYHWFFLQDAPDTYETHGRGVPGGLDLPVRVCRYLLDDHLRRHDRPHRIRRRPCFTASASPASSTRSSATGPGVRMAGWPTWAAHGNIFPSLGMGFHDFAGSTVVHTIGGFIALAGAIVLGPRLGRKFKRDGGAPMLPHDLTIAVSGGLILWFGWYGFNPGSTLSAMDFVGIGRVATNTTLAACAAGLTAMFYAYFMSKKWDAGFTTNGFLAGLVAITCPCYWVSPTGAVLLGGDRRCDGRPGSRTARMAAHRRSHRRGAGARLLRHLGNALTRAVRLRQVRRDRPGRSRQLRSAEGTFLRRRNAGAGGASHRQRVHHPRHVRSGHGRDVRGQRNGNPSRCRKKANCTAWTCTSTASRLIRST